MTRKTIPVLVHAAAFFFIACACVFAANAQYNLKVPVKTYKVGYCSYVFNIDTQKVFTVSKDVTSLSDLYEFSWTAPIVISRNRPARIILVLDASQSMCEEVTRCSGASKNDPTNKRIEAANAFVDSVSLRCPDCEIGVIIYTAVGNDSTGSGTISEVLEPIKLNEAANLEGIHQAINAAACGEAVIGSAREIEANRLGKRTLTFTGMALDSAIKLADEGYDSINFLMERHIILLTDGDWQRPTTTEIITAYSKNFPARQLPRIHGIFISDSATHVANGFPPQGLIDCDSLNKVPVDLSFLQLATQASYGKYFSNTTPQTVPAAFDSLSKAIVEGPITIYLTSVTFTDLFTGEQRAATLMPDPAFPQGGHYRIAVPPFNLAFGLNTFSVTWTTKDNNFVQITFIDTIFVNRLATDDTSGIDLNLKKEWITDTVHMSINCKPGSLPIKDFDTVTAAVDQYDTARFSFNSIILRAFIPFPDETDNRVIALFHLEDHKLANSVPGGQPGSGSPTLSKSGAFGNAVGNGYFTFTPAMTISGDFTVECWIRPGDPQSAAMKFSSSHFAFGLENGYLVSNIGDNAIRSTHALDKNAWQHVAVARVNGSTNLYINGIPAATPVNMTGAISGALTIGNMGEGFLDEVRISLFARTITCMGKTLLQIPTAENLQWKINTLTSTSPFATLASEMWRGNSKGKVQFQFTSLAPGPMIINFFDTLSTPLILWSKNGDPVNFSTTGIRVGKNVANITVINNRSLKIFDLKGRLLTTIFHNRLYSKKTNVRGVYLVKYPDGKIEKRMQDGW